MSSVISYLYLAVVCRTGSDYIHVLTTNVVGPYLTTKFLLPLLMKKKTRVVVNSSSLYDSMNATYDDTEGHHKPTGSVLLPSNTSKAALNMRKLLQIHAQCTRSVISSTNLREGACAMGDACWCNSH